MTTENLRDMSDDDLDALLGGDDESTADETTTEQAEPQGEVSEPPAEQDPPAEPAAPEETPQPQARQVPLAELQRERQRRQQYEASLNDPNVLAQRLQQLGYQVAQQQQQQPEFLDESLAQYTDQRLQGFEGQISQMEQRLRAQMSVDMAKIAIPDWEQTVNAMFELANDPEMAPVLQALDNQVMQSPNPAMAMYNYAKRLAAPKPASSEADIERRIAEGVAAALAKQQPGIQGPKGVARAGSVTPGVEPKKSIREMTDEELDRLAYGEE